MLTIIYSLCSLQVLHLVVIVFDKIKSLIFCRVVVLFTRILLHYRCCYNYHPALATAAVFDTVVLLLLLLLLMVSTYNYHIITLFVCVCVCVCVWFAPCAVFLVQQLDLNQERKRRCRKFLVSLLHFSFLDPPKQRAIE